MIPATGRRPIIGRHDVQQFLTLWQSLDPRRRVIVIAATLGMFAAVLGLARLAATPSLSLLYAGLEGAAAGEVVAALEQRGVAHEARGGAIFVPAGRRDSLRMALAADGLPAQGPEGYEILDSLSGFSTTAQMFDAAYWRAREGELARTILSAPGVRAARVHIAAPSTRPFARDARTSASVTLRLAGGSVGAGRARALRHLVAAAVAGMSPEDVEVIDGEGLRVVSPGAGADGLPAPGADPLAGALRGKVKRLLAARLGPGRAAVEVSVERRRESERVSEVRLDPKSRVEISTETRKSSESSNDSAGEAGVTVASNLPEADTGAGGGSSRKTAETVERVNYEVSEIRRETARKAGAIARISVAVLLDSGGAEPVSEAGISELTDLVATAVGADPERGDRVTVKAMAMSAPAGAQDGTAAAPALWQRLGVNVMAVIRIAALTLVALILGLFVLRPLLTARRNEQAAALTDRAGEGAQALPAATETGAADAGAAEAGSRELVPAARLEEAGRPDDADPVSRLRRLIDERRNETVEILRSWMDDEDATA